MRSPEEVIQLVLGRPDFSHFSQQAVTGSAGFFSVHRVDLPMPDFQGFPDKWLFAILTADERDLGNKSHIAKEVLRDGQSLIDRRPDKGIPLVFISQDERIHLGDEFTLPRQHVFSIESTEIPKKRRSETAPHASPFMAAFRRVVSTRDPAMLYFSPYQRGTPVSGWRFFGRKHELERLVYSADNFVVVGGRRTGKTSLLQEANRLLQRNGEVSYWIPVQHCRSHADVVQQILNKLSSRDVAVAHRRQTTLGDSMLAAVLKTLVGRHRRVTLFLDELGEVITRLPDDDWSFMGTLREFAQNGELRLIISCFQEVFLKKLDFGGPFVNLAPTMRLRLFRDADVRQLVCGPLEFWSLIDPNARNDLANLVLSAVGTHPCFLQHYCADLFEHLIRHDPGGALPAVARELLGTNLISCFEAAMEEVFFDIPSAAVRYLFVKRCHEGDLRNHELRRLELDDKWCSTTLASLGYSSTTAGRRRLLDSLEIHGLTTAVSGDASLQGVGAPIVYQYLKQIGSIPDLLATLADDMCRECSVWELERNTKGV